MYSYLPFALLSVAAVVEGSPLPGQTPGDPDLATLYNRQDDVGTWDYNATTRIQWFTGCSNDQIKTIRQAWKDAMMLSGAIGDPAEFDPEDWLIWEYFGDYWKADSTQREGWWKNIQDNMRRMQEPQTPSWWGDWWNSRYIGAVCGNKYDRIDKNGRGCKTPGVRAHVLRADGPKGDNMLDDTVYLCDTWFDDFESTTTVIQKVEDQPDVYDRVNARTLISQGSLLFHELLHTGYTDKNRGGFLSPAGRDTEPKGVAGRYGVASGAERAKWLARSYSSFGIGATKDNVDNYIYFAISRFMEQRWGKLVTKPEAYWPSGKASASQATDDDNSEGDDKDDGLTDEERDAKCASKPCKGYQDCEGVCPEDGLLNPICGTEGVCICGNQHPILVLGSAFNKAESR